MTRKQFFATITGLSVGAGTAKTANLPELPKPAEIVPGKRYEYKNWTIWWTGWKGHRNCDAWAAQWIARHPDLPDGYIWVSPSPGPVYLYRKGDMFSLDCQEDQVLLNTMNTEQEFNQERDWALAKLVNLIDRQERLGRIVEEL